MGEYIDYNLIDIDKRKVVDLVGDINNNNLKEKDLKESTRAEYRKTLKKFLGDFLENMKQEYQELEKEFDGKDLTEFFNSTAPKSRPDPDRLPTPNTVRELVKNATNNRDKALIMTLWSTGGRIGELLGLRWKDLKFKTRQGERIAQVHFKDTKTGGDRKVPVRSGLTYLNKWETESTESNNPDKYIFHNLDNGKQLGYTGARKIVTRASKNSDIDPNKKINFHAFRKARATFLASKGMNQSTLCEYMGWVQGSDIAAVYVGLSESDKENSIMEMAGIETTEEETESDLLPVKCHNPDCRELNPFEAESCKECGEVLKTSDRFEEIKIQEATDDLVYEYAKSEKGYTDAELKEKAKELLD